MATGMYHCGGGPGPNSFDMLTALEGWVENRIPPESIIATKFLQDNTSQGVVRTMPLCTFPEQARYRGNGDFNEAGNWSAQLRIRLCLKSGSTVSERVFSDG